MPHYEGPGLRTALVELGHVPTEAELRLWLKPVLDAVTVLHDSGTWHQNIGPEAILITPTGPVLLGFASAAHAIEALHHRPAAALRAGFAAIEQYGSAAGTMRGPWTDLYALAATVYAAVTGADPAPAADRLAHDHVRPLSIVAAGLYSKGFLAAIDAAMAIQPQQRPADHAEFRALMGDIEAPATVSLAPRPDLMQELFLPAPDEQREVTVPDPPRAAVTEPPPAIAAVAPKPARQTPPIAAPAATSADRALPSWMTRNPSPAAGKRLLYGVIAGTCALIGVAALVLQFATRPAPRAASPRPRLRSSRPPPRLQPPRRRRRPCPCPCARPHLPAFPRPCPCAQPHLPAFPRPRPSPSRRERPLPPRRQRRRSQRRRLLPPSPRRSRLCLSGLHCPRRRRWPHASPRPSLRPRPNRQRRAPSRRRHRPSRRPTRSSDRRAASTSCRKLRSRRSPPQKPSTSRKNANDPNPPAARRARPRRGARRRHGGPDRRVLFVGAADVREGCFRCDRCARRPDGPPAVVPGACRRAALQTRPRGAQADDRARSDARHDHGPADRGDRAVRTPRDAADRQRLSAVRVSALRVGAISRAPPT